MNVHRITVGVVGLALVVPSIGACGQVAEKASEAAVEQALEGEGQDVDITEDGATVTDDQGNKFTVGADVALPDNWPAEIPTFDGGTLSLVSVEGSGRVSAVWVTEASVEEASAAYVGALKAAGYTETSMANANGMVVGTYTGNGYTVNVNTMGADGQTSVMVGAERTSG